MLRTSNNNLSIIFTMSKFMITVVIGANIMFLFLPAVATCFTKQTPLSYIRTH